MALAAKKPRRIRLGHERQRRREAADQSPRCDIFAAGGERSPSLQPKRCPQYTALILSLLRKTGTIRQD